MNRKRIVCLIVIIGVLFLAAFDLFAGGQTDKPSEKKTLIGMYVLDLSLPYYAAAAAGAELKAEEIGVDLMIKAVGWEPAKPLDLIDNFITMGVDGVIASGVQDSKVIIPGVKKLNDAGIPIIFTDSCAAGGYVDFFIAMDKAKANEMSTELFIETLKKKHGGVVPKGVVIELMGSEMANIFTIKSHAGVDAVLSKYPQIKVVQGIGDWCADGAFKVVSDYITRFGDEILGVVNHAPDCMGAGMANAFTSAGKDPADYVLTGACMGPEGLDLIKKGEMTSIAVQPIYWANYMAVELIHNIKTGKPVPQIGDIIEEEGAIWSPAEVIQNPFTDGGSWIMMQSALVPQQVSPDDPRLYENILTW
jgi:ribose transport system substrate-binding protein